MQSIRTSQHVLHSLGRESSIVEPSSFSGDLGISKRLPTVINERRFKNVSGLQVHISRRCMRTYSTSATGIALRRRTILRSMQCRTLLGKKITEWRITSWEIYSELPLFVRLQLTWSISATWKVLYWSDVYLSQRGSQFLILQIPLQFLLKMNCFFGVIAPF